MIVTSDQGNFVGGRVVCQAGLFIDGRGVHGLSALYIVMQQFFGLLILDLWSSLEYSFRCKFLHKNF